MRELTGRAQTDIRKLIGGVPWIELLEVRLPDGFTPTAAERKFLAQSPDGGWWALLTNIFTGGHVALAAAGWQTEGLAAGYKWFFSVPYERDTVADSDERQGMMDSRVTLGDAGGVVHAIAERCDGFYGAAATLGFAMQKGDAGDNVALGDGVIECHEPEVVLDFTIGQSSFNGNSFSCLLSSDTPLEWKFPEKVMLKNVCHFQFRGLECGFTGDTVRQVRTTRRGTGETAVFPGHWALFDGYIQRLEPNGFVRAFDVPGFTGGDYVHLASAANDYFYAVREGGVYVIYFDGTAAATFNVAAQKPVKSVDYPLAHVLVSGGAHDAYAITNTAATRYLYHFAGAVRTRVGTGQYFNIVSSPVAGVCYAVQGGAYSGAGGAFVQSNSATGRLVRVEGEVVTDIGGGRLYKWCRAAGWRKSEVFPGDTGYSCEVYALASDNKLWLVDDDGGEGGAWATFLSQVQYYDLKIGGPIGDVALPGVPRFDQFHHNNSAYGGGLLAFIIDGVLWAGLREQAYYSDDASVWRIVRTIPGREDFQGEVCMIANGDGGTQVMRFTDFDEGIFAVSPRLLSDVRAVLPAADFNNTSQKFYYVAAGEVRLSEQKHFAGCDHSLTDCRERGNEQRFGGFPGVGSGGLTI